MADREWYEEMVEIMQKLQEYPASKRAEFAAEITSDKNITEKERKMLVMFVEHPEAGERVFREGLTAA